MQDEVRDRSISLVLKVGTKGARLTAEMLKQAIREWQRHRQQMPHGKQTVRQLVGQNQGVQSIEVTDRNIKPFEGVAKKYGVDFALKKDKANGKYLVFFKARDADALNAAFAEFTAKAMHKKQEKPSVRKQLAQFKELAKRMAQDKVKKRNKADREL